jgi:predicted DNA-binding antitoxin AbrB/MazE fold protein
VLTKTNPHLVGSAAMDTIHATFENGVFRPLAPVALPEGSSVELHVIPATSIDASAPPCYAHPSGSIEEALVALSVEVPSEEWQQLPHDLSDRLDHYLYGTGDE